MRRGRPPPRVHQFFDRRVGSASRRPLVNGVALGARASEAVLPCFVLISTAKDMGQSEAFCGYECAGSTSKNGWPSRSALHRVSLVDFAINGRQLSVAKSASIFVSQPEVSEDSDFGRFGRARMDRPLTLCVIAFAVLAAKSLLALPHAGREYQSP